MRIKLLIPIALTLLVALMLLQLFGPSTGGVLGPQTTYITKPLAPDGLPNYALALIEQQSKGVTRENNGAALFWQAMGPMEVNPQHYALLCRKLGIFPSADPSASLVDVSSRSTEDRLAQWVKSQYRKNSAAGDSDEDLEESQRIELATEVLGDINRTAWTADDVPPLADWVAENQAPLDLLVEASARPRFFSPPPDVLADPNTPLISMTLPGPQATRGAARSLLARATFRIGKGQHDEAWRDCLAAWRLAGQVASGATLVEKLVGIAIRGVAKQSTLVLLQSKELPEELAQQVLRDLNSLDVTLDLTDSLNNSERLMFLDFTLRLVTGRLGGFGNAGRGMAGGVAENVSKIFSLDVNESLRLGNLWYDRLASIADIKDRRKRDAAMAAFEADVSSIASGVKSKLVGGLLSRSTRSEAFGEVMLSQFLPAISAVFKANDRDEANLVLTKTAAALAIHRARTGKYPTTLEELAPGILPEIPPDPYTGMPLIYKRRGDGYLLYSVFENGVDDGGSDLGGEIVSGEWRAPDDVEGIKTEGSDLVIRLPMPPIRSLTKKRSGNDSKVEQHEPRESESQDGAKAEPTTLEP